MSGHARCYKFHIPALPDKDSGNITVPPAAIETSVEFLRPLVLPLLLQGILAEVS